MATKKTPAKGAKSPKKAPANKAVPKKAAAKPRRSTAASKTTLTGTTIAAASDEAADLGLEGIFGGGPPKEGPPKDGTPRPGDSTPPIDMDQFFQGVANSLIKAQTELDSRSADYIKATSGSPFLLPSVFRIPKVTAQLKFAVEKADERGVNFVIFKNQTTAQTTNEQSIQFDIVSAPPPPELLRAPIMVGLVFDRDRRGDILSAIQTKPWGDHPELVVIYEILQDRYLVAFASGAQAGVWFVSKDPDTAVQLSSAAGPTFAQLRATIEELGAGQKNFIQK